MSAGWTRPSGTVEEYVRTFLEWRIQYGIDDPCMDELRAAVLAESENPSLTIESRSRLIAFADLIQPERQRSVDHAA